MFLFPRLCNGCVQVETERHASLFNGNKMSRSNDKNYKLKITNDESDGKAILII